MKILLPENIRKIEKALRFAGYDKEVDAFLRRSRQQGKRCVLLVHGRGLHSKDQVPVLKEALQSWLATARFAGRHWVEGLLALPLVLPPTVLGYYLLVAMGGTSSLGRWFQAATGTTLAFSFTGLVLASLLFNLPFAVQPIQRAIEAIDPDVREAAFDNA